MKKKTIKLIFHYPTRESCLFYLKIWKGAYGKLGNESRKNEFESNFLFLFSKTKMTLL